MLRIPQEAEETARNAGSRRASILCHPSVRARFAAAAALFSGLLVLAPSATGCAHAEIAQDKQLAVLRDGVTKDEQDHDKVEPAIPASDEPLIDARKEGKGKPAPRGAPDGAKDVRVVQLAKNVGDGSDDAAEPSGSDDPEDTTPRPQIHVAGSPQPLRTAARPRARGAKDQLEPAVDDGSGQGAPVTPPAAGPEARAAYDAARNLMTQRKYKEALDGFTAFLVKWPDHPMADNAMFWRGDCYFSLGDFAHAESELAGALARFPQGIKAPDTLLKLGMTEDKLGQPDKARVYYDRLQKDFPKSEAARRIPASGGGGSGPKGPKENR